MRNKYRNLDKRVPPVLGRAMDDRGPNGLEALAHKYQDKGEVIKAVSRQYGIRITGEEFEDYFKHTIYGSFENFLKDSKKYSRQPEVEIDTENRTNPLA